MELNIQRRPIAACELILAATAEHSIECDVLLPDYCPDILRVLSCQMTGAVTDAATRTGSFSVEGMATITLCYLGEGVGLRKTEYRVPFQKTFEMPSDPVESVFTVSAEQGHLNCRAASKRRLDIRGTLLISVRVSEAAPAQVIAEVGGGGVQLCLAEREAIRIGHQALRPFSVRDEVSPALGKQPAVELLRTDCRAVAQDCHITAGRALLKGELLLHLLYKTDLDSGATEAADYTLPISQLFDVDGIEDEMTCQARLDCVSCECTLDDDDGIESESGHIRVEVQLTAVLRFYETTTLLAAIDSFSTLYAIEQRQRRMRLPQMRAAVNERVTLHEQATLPEGTLSLIDVWATPSRMISRYENGNLSAACTMTFTLLTRNGEGGFECIQHTCEVAFPIAVPNADELSEFLPRFTVLSTAAPLSDATAQITCELLISGVVIGFEAQSFLTELSVDESAPRRRDPAVGLIIYYAQAKEPVWDIAKRYGSLPRRIMEDNDLDTEVLDHNTALIIPTA